MMRTFEEYSASFKISCDFEILDSCFKESEYYIYEGQRLLLTPGGNVFSHPSERVIHFLITDLQLYNGSHLHMLSSPLLYSFRKDIFGSDNDPFLHHWEDHLASDPFVLIKTTGKSAAQQYGPDDTLFTFAFINLASLIGTVNSFTGKLMSEIIMEESDLNPFPELLRLVYSRLLPEQKVALQALSCVHHSGIVLPLLLVSGEISLVEYVKGLISLKMMPAELFSETLAGIAGVQDYLGSLMQKHGQERLISAQIREGEGDSIEFKSTLRWDIREGKTNPAIERSCMKTIAAFLNSKGGSLLIGVRDDGSIEGIETDKFANEDKFLLHLWTLIRTCLGRDFSPYIRTKLEKTGEKTVCVVVCLPSNRPAFLRQPGFDEEMYIRIGPSSNALDISEALKYIEDRFSKQQI